MRGSRILTSIFMKQVLLESKWEAYGENLPRTAEGPDLRHGWRTTRCATLSAATAERFLRPVVAPVRAWRHAAVRGGPARLPAAGHCRLDQKWRGQCCPPAAARLAQTLRSGMGQQIVAFSGKAHAVQRPRLGAGRLGHAGQGCRGSPQNSAPGLARAILLDFFGGLACHAPVRNGRSCYK